MKADFKLLCSHIVMSFCVLIKIISTPFVMLSSYVEKKKLAEK